MPVVDDFGEGYAVLVLPSWANNLRLFLAWHRCLDQKVARWRWIPCDFRLYKNHSVFWYKPTQYTIWGLFPFLSRILQFYSRFFCMLSRHMTTLNFSSIFESISGNRTKRERDGDMRFFCLYPSVWSWYSFPQRDSCSLHSPAPICRYVTFLAVCHLVTTTRLQQ